MYDKPYFDRAILRLHTTLSYGLLYYMYDKPRFDKAILHLDSKILYNILYYIFGKPHKKFCTVLYLCVKYM